jgi:hypothetical protein
VEALGGLVLISPRAVISGAGVKQVQPALAHASAVIAVRTYARLRPGREDRTRSAVDAVLGGLRAGCGPKDQGLKEAQGQTV